MRFRRLELLRYGPFTDKVLTFRPEAKLHLVFGPNEAGKSSSLAAIGDLLFGFAKRKEYDFLHEAATLRIGAEVVSRDGASLAFRRRRGNKKTLLGADDDEVALHEDVLSPFLGNLSREVFSRAFGLNSDSLREGGAAMLASEGEMGAALFAAASGLTGLARVRRTLEAEADDIFAPRASKDRRFYQALERYNSAITAERQNELKSSDWKALVAEIDDIEGRLADLKERRAATSTALARLQRLKALQPIVNAMDELNAGLEKFAGLPEVPEGFVADCAAALDAAESAAAQERLAAEEMSAAAAALEAINVDEALVDRAAEIIDLFSRKGDYLSKRSDLPRIEAERDDINETLAAAAHRLGLREAAEVGARLPSAATLAGASTIIAAGQKLEAAIAANEARLAEELASIETQEAEGNAGSLIDPKPWRDQFVALQPDLKQLGDQGFLETSHRNTLQKLRDTGMRMTPQVGDIEALVGASLPSRDTIAAHKATFERIMGERRAEAIALEANARQLTETEQKLIETERSGPVAYDELIKLTRADRDETFRRLRDQLLRIGSLMMPVDVSDKVAQFEEESAEADSIADQAIADADRISRIAAYREKLAELARQRPVIEARIATLAEEQSAAAQNYAALFAPVGIIPVGPDAMIAWLSGVEDMMTTRRDAEVLAEQIAGLEGLGRQVHAALVAIAKNIGISGIEAMPPLALSRLINAAIDEMTVKWNARLSFEGARQAARVRVGQIEDALYKARREHKEWQDRFEALLPQIGLRKGMGTDEAAAALAVWATTPEAVKQRINRGGRITGMQRDVTKFENEVHQLARALVPVLGNLPAQGLIDVLRDRAEMARAAKARQADAKARLTAAETRLATARTALEAAQLALAALSGRLPAGTDPRTALLRLEPRDALRAQLAARRQEFEAHADGVTEEQIRVELPDFDRDRAQFDAEDLERVSDTLHIENNQLYAVLGQRHARREQLELGTGAEFAVFERRGAETEIIATARHWAVRKIAATMLGAAIEKHREAQTDPLMLRAGQLFNTLTSGSFSSLVQDYGDDDLPRLVGVRKSGERVAISGMSEGTRDQLYLSLRLAYIEDYAERTEPVPFIGDDIFQTFDDERTASGLKAFASTSGVFQPIVFTHHLSVVAIARRALGEELDLIEL